MKTVILKQSKSRGDEEYYYESFKCPNCKQQGLSKYDNYCKGCGLKLKYENDTPDNPRREISIIDIWE